jgi:Dna[CI] antecedent DciA-like protein
VDKLGNILPTVLRRQPGGGRMLGSRVAAEFRAMIGPEPARLCEDVELKSGVLIITTSSPALAHQLRLDAETVVRRLNELELGRHIRSLRVRIGRSTPA